MRPPLKSLRACGPFLNAPLTPADRFAATPLNDFPDLFEIGPFFRDALKQRAMIQRSLQRPECPFAAMFELV
jgi:hypothetical protein